MEKILDYMKNILKWYDSLNGTGKFIVIIVVLCLLGSCTGGTSSSSSSGGSHTCAYCGKSCSAFEDAMYGGHKSCMNAHKSLWDASH